jgi:hypothetical protein
MASLAAAARIVVAVVLAVAALLKLRNREALRTQLRDFGIPARSIPGVAVLLPAVELATAVALVAFPRSGVPAGIAVFLLALFTAVVGVNLARGHRVPCPCFGVGGDAPISPRTMVRNGWLLAVAVLSTGSSAHATAGAVAAITVGLGAATLVVLRSTG